ncbi:MAG: TerB family tellurite resistance protein [Rhodospirillaceae bacterium]|nr:TerB family tellurite resistance protein [Rhodospirillaceae bacterium]
MPYLLGFLGLLVTVLILLSRLADAGIDLGGLNPFLWRRRRAWRQKFEANPLFGLDQPMEAAAVLAVGVAKADGDMSTQQKQALLERFQQTFNIDARMAEDLLSSSAHLAGDGRILRDQVHDVIARSKEQFTDKQIDSTLSLLEDIAAVEGASKRQRELISNVEDSLRDQTTAGTWD